MQCDIEILKDLHRHCKVLVKTNDPRRRIAASEWEIFFEQKLAQAEGESKETAQPAEVQ